MVLPARSVITFVEETDNAARARGMVCAPLSLSRCRGLEAIPVCFDAAVEREDLVPPGFVVILVLSESFFVRFEPPWRLQLQKAGNKREGSPIPMAIGHLVN